jgi:cytochrome c biogenesis protein
MPGQGPLKAEIADGPAAVFSGLQVKYDPGVWLVFLGCGLMVAGFFIAFYLSHKKVWIRLGPAGGGGALVEIAGTTNKNRPALKRLLLKLAEEMRKAA